MSGLGGRSTPSQRVLARRFRQRCVDLYGEVVAEQLRMDEGYTLVSVGSFQFAFTHYDTLAAALEVLWDQGFVPLPPRHLQGSELPDEAPKLQGVDLDLGAFDLRRLGGRGRFER